MKIRIDMTQFTFGDAADLEELGFDLADARRAVTSGRAPFKLAIALLWIFKRKSDPTFTYDQARDLSPFGEEALEIEWVEAPASPKGPVVSGPLPSSVSPPDTSRKKSRG